MADEKQVAMLKRSVEVWNAWRYENPTIEIDLSSAQLTRAHLKRANLRKANLRGANLRRAFLDRANLSAAALSNSDLQFANLNRGFLKGADLQHANLRNAELREADLRDARANGAQLQASILRGANIANADFCTANFNRANLQGTSFAFTNLTNAELIGADLKDAGFQRAILTGANLKGANLVGAVFWSAKLDRANFAGVELGWALFAQTDLSGTRGLGAVRHGLSSSISTDTLLRTATGLSVAGHEPDQQQEIVVFLRGAGVSEAQVETFRLEIGKPIEFYSCFISYSHVQQSFARRLYDTLQGRGIRCWLDEHAMVPGDRLFDKVNDAIRSTDRVLLVCSIQSLTSDWVSDEVAMTFEKEVREKRDILIPLMVDDSLLSWESAQATKIRQRLAADFTGWESDNAKFEAEFEKVVQALRPGDASRQGEGDG